VVFVVQLVGLTALALVAFVDVHDSVTDSPGPITLFLGVMSQVGSWGKRTEQATFGHNVSLGLQVQDVEPFPLMAVPELQELYVTPQEVG